MKTPAARARIAGGIAVAAGAGLVAMGEAGAGLGALTAGAAILLLVTEQGVPDDLPDAAAAGPQASLAAVARELELRGRGIIIPGATRDQPATLFVPVQDVALDSLGRIDPTLVFHRDEASALGIALAPPGRGLEAAWRAGHGLPEGAGAEEAAVHVRGAFTRFGLGRDLVFARSSNFLRIEYTSTVYAEACRRAAEEQAPWHMQGGCPACSLAAILAGWAYNRPIRLRDGGFLDGMSWIDLEILQPAKGQSEGAVASSPA